MSTETTQSADARKSRARSKALTRLRDANKEQWNKILKEEMAAEGVDWTPRPDAREKARQEVARLMREHGLTQDEVLR